MNSDTIKKVEELADKNDSNAQNELGVYIMERARLIAVVGLDNNTFKPHT